MSTPLAPWTRRVREILSDGEWHTYDELVAAAGPLVPPGRARRDAEKHRLRRSGVPVRVYQRVGELEVGRRSIVVRSIRQLERGRHVETVDRRARIRVEVSS